MNMVVLVKQVIDPEAPPASFKVDEAAKTVTLPPNISPVVDPYAEYAVEAALRIKDSKGEGKITAVSLGNDLSREVVRKPLAMGADELILLEDEAFSGGDGWTTANALAMAIKKIGDYDLILCGRQASDWDAGQVGLGVATILGLPIVTLARSIEVLDGKVKVERLTDDGHEVIEAELPAVVTVTNELGEPRYPSIKGIMAAKKVEPTVWKPADIGLEPSQVGEAGRLSQLVKLYQPVSEGKCEIVEGETLEEAGINLALKLRESKIL